MKRTKVNLSKLKWKVQPWVYTIAGVCGLGVGSMAILLNMSFYIVLASGATAAGGAAWLMAGMDGSKKIGDNLYECDVADILKEIEATVQTLKGLCRQISRSSGQDQVEEMIRYITDTYDYLVENEEYAPVIREFLEIYVKKAVSILEQYIKAQKYPTSNSHSILDLTERTYLPSLVEYSRKQRDHLYDLSLEDLKNDATLQAKLIDLEKLGHYDRSYD